MSLRAQFLEFDDALAAHGVPGLTPWWREGIGQWLDAYEQRRVLEFLACVGRGAAKSTALYKLALCFTIFGDFVVPPGERHFAIILSRLKEEASKGVQIINRWLDLLGVPHSLAGDVIELEDMPRGIRVVAASVSAASGWRAFFVGKDERSKWPASGDSPNVEAAEIDASASAMTATHPAAPIVAFGSAWARLGSFYEAIASGTDSHKHVIGPTPTWIAAPHVTEESTRKKERDPAMWSREYACIASEEHEESIFRAALLDGATRAESGDLPREPGVSYVAAMDPALYLNAWTLCIAGQRMVAGRIRRSVVAVREWKPKPGAPLDPAPVLAEIKSLLAGYGLAMVYSDQAGKPHVANAGRIGLGIYVVESTQVLKIELASNMLARLSDGEDELPPHPQLRADLLAVRRKLTVSGFTIHLPTTPDGRHCDYAPSAMLALDRCRYEPDLPPPPSLSPNEAAIARLKRDEDRMWAQAQTQGRHRRELGARPLLDAPPTRWPGR